MQKDANLVEVEKCCQTHIFLQNFVFIQPRTSPPKIYKILLIFPILLTLTPNPLGSRPTGGAGAGAHLRLGARRPRAPARLRAPGPPRTIRQILSMTIVVQFLNKSSCSFALLEKEKLLLCRSPRVNGGIFWNLALLLCAVKRAARTRVRLGKSHEKTNLKTPNCKTKLGVAP